MNTQNYLKVGLLIALLSLSYASQAQINLNNGLKLGKQLAKDAQNNKKSKLAEQYTTKETTSEGLELLIMRVPVDKIKSDSKNSIIETQNELQTAYARYKSKNAIDNLIKIQDAIRITKVRDKEWIVANYESEFNFYESYEKNRIKEEREAEKKRKEYELEQQRKRVDSLKKANEQNEYLKQIQGYHFVNTEDLSIKENTQDKSKELGKIGLCSYVRVLDSINVNGYIKIKVDDITGYVLSKFVVNDLDKVNAPYEIMQRAKKRNYTNVTKTPSEEEIKEIQRVQKEEQQAQKKLQKNTGTRYYRGPKGGCYYINSSGKKQYVDRSYCN